MASVDVKALKQSTDIVQVISRYGVLLKKSGPRYVANCPFHSESTASFTVTQGNRPSYKCFGCGKSGDVIDFLIHYAGRSFKEAVAELQDPNNVAAIVPGSSVNTTKVAVTEWQAVEPRAPFKTPDTTHYMHGKPSKVWYYRNAEGHPIGLVCRFDLGGGKKEVIPLTFCTNGQGREEWRWKGLNKPRPLYNLNLISIRQNEPVMIGEGEKTADAMHQLFIEYTCTTWIGGGEGVKNTDWTPLYGRDILLWPDNDKDKTYKTGNRRNEVMDFEDQPGNKAMLLIASILKDHCPNIKWVKNPEDAPCGWDVADSTWTIEEATSYLSQNIIDVPQKIVLSEIKNEVAEVDQIKENTSEAVTETPAEVITTNQPPIPPIETEKQKDKGIRGGGYFKMLGYQKDVNVNLYHFYSYKSKSVISLSPSAMTKPNLLALAPLNWWEDQFPRYAKGNPVGGFELDSAQSWLINESVTHRIFNRKWIRGRGAWMDGKHTVIHSGEKLIVDGSVTDFIDFPSKYIYEIGEDMGFKMAEPLKTKQSGQLLDVLKLVNFNREIDAYLLAGWCVVAPMCGALQWRPHVWLTGAAGTGKSWIFQYLVRRLLGESAMAVQGKSTEAGVRQLLKNDALPVVFDEAEGEDKKAQERIAEIISLMRSSSSSDGGLLTHGSSGGKANTYEIRSCFAFASIGIQVVHQSDRTRITVLSLKKASDNKASKERWKELQKKYHNTITEEYCAKLRARTISILPVILKNAVTFSHAAAAELGQQRAGDQVGVLLAGAYSLRSSKEISYKEALAWIQQKDWSEEKAQDQTRDELALIQHILSQITRIEADRGVHERTIGELVKIAAGLIHTDTIIDREQAAGRLNRIGIKVRAMDLIIGNSVPQINQYLSGTHWAKNYNKILQRLDGATDVDPTNFASGMKIRATKIPLLTLFKNEQGSLFETDTEKVETNTAGIIVKKEDDEDLPF